MGFFVERAGQNLALVFLTLAGLFVVFGVGWTAITIASGRTIRGSSLAGFVVRELAPKRGLVTGFHRPGEGELPRASRVFGPRRASCRG
ncbi:hypothetical protein PA103_0645 [Pseudomonas aeruginosa PA103]|nr:hypothetical protein PA103_0645 [Pseudomonas aeruginosa PA103]